MLRFLTGSDQVYVSGRYRVRPVELPSPLTELALTPEQVQTLASYARPATDLHAARAEAWGCSRAEAKARAWALGLDWPVRGMGPLSEGAAAVLKAWQAVAPAVDATQGGRFQGWRVP